MNRSIASNLLCWAGLAIAIAGCTTREPAAPPKDSVSADMKDDPVDVEIRDALAKLDPEDKRLAEQQKFCAVQSDSPLGSMGVPYKLDVKGQTVFLCCKGCSRRALADPNKTLAQVDRLKASAAESATKQSP